MQGSSEQEGDASAVFDQRVVDGDERNQEQEEPLHDFSNPDTARAEEPFTEKFHHILHLRIHYRS